MEKIPVVVLTGFLGSGKTTLLRHLLSLENDLSEVAVVLNDFGKIGIDGQLVQSPGLQVVEMGSGCICCTLQIDLRSTLLQLIEDFALRLIFIEASGIAEPAAINAVLESEPLKDHLELSKVITVLDADYWEARDAFGKVFSAQLEEADVILLNKIDEFSEDMISESLKGIKEAYPGPAVIPTLYCQVEPDILQLEQAAKPSAAIAPDSCGHTHEVNILSTPAFDYSGETLSSKGYKSFSYSEEAVFDKHLFIQFLQNLPWELFRIKGLVRFAKQTEVLNYVGGKINWNPYTEAVKETSLVFIGWGSIDQEKILADLEKCKCS